MSTKIDGRIPRERSKTPPLPLSSFQTLAIRWAARDPISFLTQ
jgi:hypothetical protein